MPDQPVQEPTCPHGIREPVACPTCDPGYYAATMERDARRTAEIAAEIGMPTPHKTTNVMAFVRPPRRVYKDRVGRVITDPETIEARWLQDHIGRAALRRYKAGLKGDPTVGEVAQAIGLTPERVVEIVRERDVWLWGLVENDGPVATWWVFLDGE